MAQVNREKDYTIRFDDLRSKLDRKVLNKFHNDYETSPMRKLDVAAYGRQYYAYEHNKPSMPTNDVKFCVSERMNYKLHDGYSVSYRHKDHDKKLEDKRAEENRMRDLYSHDSINSNLDDYEVKIEPHLYGGSVDIFRLPIEIKL